VGTGIVGIDVFAVSSVPNPRQLPLGVTLLCVTVAKFDNFYVRIRHIHLKLPAVKLRQEASHILTYHLERNASLPLIHDRTLVIYDNGMVQQWLGGPLSALSKFLGRCCNGFPQT